MIKGLLVSLLTFPVYKKMSNHIKAFIAKVEPDAPVLTGR